MPHTRLDVRTNRPRGCREFESRAATHQSLVCRTSAEHCRDLAKDTLCAHDYDMPAVACVTIGEVAAQMVYSLVRQYMTQIAHFGGDDPET